MTKSNDLIDIARKYSLKFNLGWYALSAESKTQILQEIESLVNNRHFVEDLKKIL